MAFDERYRLDILLEVENPEKLGFLCKTTIENNNSSSNNKNTFDIDVFYDEEDTGDYELMGKIEDLDVEQFFITVDFLFNELDANNIIMITKKAKELFESECAARDKRQEFQIIEGGVK